MTLKSVSLRPKAVLLTPICISGTICGSVRSMGRAAQSMDPWFAQESMDRRVGPSCLRDLCILRMIQIISL